MTDPVANPMRRLHALLAHTTVEGPEAEAAHRALARFVQRHPDLRWALETGGGVVVTRELECLTGAHRTMLFPLACHYGCKLRVAKVTHGEVHTTQAWIEGPKVVVNRCCATYQQSMDRVDMLANLIAEHLVKAHGAHDAPTPDEIEGCVTYDHEEVEPDDDPWVTQETDRMARMTSIAMESDPKLLLRLSQRAAIMLAPRRTVALIEGEVGVAWDSPDLTLDAFMASWRAAHPSSSRNDLLLEGEWRAGRRMNPVTRKLIRVPGLERPWGTE